MQALYLSQRILEQRFLQIPFAKIRLIKHITAAREETTIEFQNCKTYISFSPIQYRLLTKKNYAEIVEIVIKKSHMETPQFFF